MSVGIAPSPDLHPDGHVDRRGCAVSGATPAALRAYERALAMLLSWRPGADAAIEQALQAAPRFVMAHVLRACLLVCSREPRQIAAAREALVETFGLPARARERRHLAALAAVLEDDYVGARARLDECLEHEPRDLLALHAVQSLEHLSGDMSATPERAERLLAAWPAGLDGGTAVRSMHAFALVEAGDYMRAEQAARMALDHDPLDLRTHHVMAHVFEMTDRAAEGRDWIRQRIDRFGLTHDVSVHLWWHLALFEWATGDSDAALRLYDRRIRSRRSTQIADLIDATSLLWRIALRAGDTDGRWHELAAAWAPHVDDSFCSFSDLHAMLAFVGAGRWDLADRLEGTLWHAESLNTRHAATTREVGLPACRALMAFGRGDDALAVRLLAGMPRSVQRLGGSHAQRDLLYLTLLRAVERLRRPANRRPLAEESA
jgi:Tfp pilus assembly protein PilF